MSGARWVCVVMISLNGLACGAAGDGTGGVGGGATPWPTSMDPLASAAGGGFERAPALLPTSAELLEDALASGDVQPAEYVRYRLHRSFGWGEAPPDQFRKGEGELESDQMLDDIDAILDIAAEDDPELAVWRLPWWHPDHPFFPAPNRSAGAGAGTTGGFVALRTSAPSAQNCPQDGPLPTPAAGTMDGVTVSAAAAQYCWQPLNENVTLLWPQATSAMDAAQVQAEIESAIPVLQEAWSRYLQLFQTAPSVLGPGSIVVAFSQSISVDTGGTSGGFHRHFGPGESVVYISLDPTSVTSGSGTPWSSIRAHTLAHEMFHAFHYQLRQAQFEAPRKWLTESLADWGAKKVTGQDPLSTVAGENVYHRAMGRFFNEVQLGLTAVQYPVHMFWHDLESVDGLFRVQDVLQAHLQSGANQAALEAADLESNWHDHAKHLLHHDPWKRFSDTPAFPNSWKLAARGHFTIATDPYCAEPETFPLPAVSALRISIDMPAQPEQLYLRASFGLMAGDTSGFEWSAALHPAEHSLSLETNTANLLCFSSNSEVCQDGDPLPSTTSIDLVLSNSDTTKTLEPRILVCTLPSEMRGKTIRVGETEVDITGELKLLREGPDNLRLTAEDVWFDFDDDTYDRLIPEGSASERVNVSADLIRDYVKNNAVFRGFVELAFEIDGEKEPEEKDGRWWIPLKTSREDQGDFFATGHKFFLKLDEAWFEAMGGVLGPAAVVLQRVIYRFNRSALPEGSFGDTLHDWFVQMMTLGSPDSGDGHPWYTVDSSSGELLFRMGNTVLTMGPL